jgi:hypothetical protein
MNVTVVIPTIGRPSLGLLLTQLVSGKQCYNTVSHSRLRCGSSLGLRAALLESAGLPVELSEELG